MLNSRSRRPAVLLLWFSVALIAFFTLRPTELVYSVPSICVFCGSLGGVDFLLNVILFVPFGAAARHVLGRHSLAVVLGLAATLAIEILQWRLIPGRDASVGDVIANTIGTAYGSWLAIAGVRWVTCSGAAARRLAVICGLATAGLLLLSAFLLLPAEPRFGQYVEWVPDRPNTERFRGHLVAVQLNGRLLRPQETFPSQWTLDSLTRNLSVQAVLRPPVPPTRRLAIVVRIANGLEEGFLLGQRGNDAVFRTWSHAARLKLRSISVGLENAFGDGSAPDEEMGVMVVSGLSQAAAMTLSRVQARDSAEVTVPRTIGLGWALIFPWDVALTPAWWPVNALWLCLLVVPVSFLTWRSGHSANARRPSTWWWPLVLVVGSGAGASLVFGVSPPSAVEWLAVITGIATGILLARWTDPSRPANLSQP
ncbi:MAG TPA: VanZ family protein [Gemmatimonadaceae bacterium]